MQSAAAISLVCWALARGAPACFGTTSLTRPVSAKARLNANQNIAFCYHLGTPDHEVLLYHKFILCMKGIPESALKIIVGCGGGI